MRIFVFGTMYLRDLDAVLKVLAWLRIARQHQVDIMLVDSNSPANLVSLCGFQEGEYFSFPDNIGHNGRPGQGDGWGRAFCRGVELAIEGKYDYAVHMESDLLCGVRFTNIIERMIEAKKPFAAPWCPPVSALETGLMFMEVAQLRLMEFVKCYDWPTLRYPEHCEDRVTRIFGDECLILRDLRGARFESREKPSASIGWFTPEHLDYFSHIRPWAYDLYTRNADGSSRTFPSERDSS